MKFAYENLGSEQFEKLVVCLCQYLLGISVQSFAKGPDGGRDAKFTGTAELFPSRAAPWIGTTIVQAKHTNGYNRNFSESDFFSKKTKNSVLGKEIPRIKKLWAAKQLDHYMLFANRRLAGKAETEIREYMAAACGMPTSSIYLCGVEQLEMWLKRFPQAAKDADLDPVDSPLIISPEGLAEVVLAMAQQIDKVTALRDDPPTPRVSYARKNTLNNMSAKYAEVQCRKYLKETRPIQTFLAAPENLELLRLYESVTDEFQLKIIAKRKSYQTFDEVMEYMVDQLFSRDPVLRQNTHKPLTRAMLFYMYWNCDIGEGDDATTD